VSKVICIESLISNTHMKNLPDSRGARINTKNRVDFDSRRIFENLTKIKTASKLDLKNGECRELYKQQLVCFLFVHLAIRSLRLAGEVGVRVTVKSPYSQSGPAVAWIKTRVLKASPAFLTTELARYPHVKSFQCTSLVVRKGWNHLDWFLLVGNLSHVALTNLTNFRS